MSIQAPRLCREPYPTDALKPSCQRLEGHSGFHANGNVEWPNNSEPPAALVERATPTTHLNRCAVCGWPLAESRDKGCARGDCSQRPLPERFYDPERAKAEYSPHLDNDQRTAPASPASAVVERAALEQLIANWRFWQASDERFAADSEAHMFRGVSLKQCADELEALLRAVPSDPQEPGA